MPWKDNYTTTDDVSLSDGQVRWPEGNQCCVNFVVDLSLTLNPLGASPADLKLSDRAIFGLEEGLNRVLSVFDHFDIAATFTVPTVMVSALQDKLDFIQARGHEIAPNSFKHENLTELSMQEESDRIGKTIEVFRDLTGNDACGWFNLPRQTDRFPVGSVSENTIGLLIDAGFKYINPGMADDIPYYWADNKDTTKSILALPYYYHFDDQFFLLFPPKGGTGMEHADALFANWNAEFKAQYKRGRYFSMVIHPHAIAWCNRFQLLETFLTTVANTPDVWSATSKDCALFWRSQYPSSEHLSIKPSIWQDYEGSLS